MVLIDLKCLQKNMWLVQNLSMDLAQNMIKLIPCSLNKSSRNNNFKMPFNKSIKKYFNIGHVNFPSILDPFAVYVLVEYHY